MLFLCTHNAGRSQMALGFFQHYAGDAAVAWSGGSEPGDEVNPAAVAAMAERGIDISGEYPKPWTDEIVRAADVVITMGCGDACPVFPGKRYEEWVLTDPAGLDVAAVRPVRDDIERRVRRCSNSTCRGLSPLTGSDRSAQRASRTTARSPALGSWGTTMSPESSDIGYSTARRHRRAPASCMSTNIGTDAGAMPANVFDSIRAMSIIGLAKLVEELHQYAAVM